MTETITAAVKSKYGSVAASGLSTDHRGSEGNRRGVRVHDGRAGPSIPRPRANMALSRGNPTATAGLRPGETVVDLGIAVADSTCLGAARRVGPSGRAIGIDMTPEMLDLARRNAEKAGLANVEFHRATIDKLPLPDASADWVISNCVINLAPDKPAVFREIVRVLKPGGRLAISDIALKRELPPGLGDDLLAYVGCIAGRKPDPRLPPGFDRGRFADVEVIDSRSDLNAYAKVENQVACCSPPAFSSTPLAVVDLASCPVGPAGRRGCMLHARLADLLETLRRERVRRQREGLRHQAR